jgi:hypothetical protein
MSATRDPETVLAAWLDEGPTDLPDATRRAILTAIPTTQQARRGSFAPWRLFEMNPTTRIVAAAAVLIVAVVGAAYLFSPRSNVGGPTATLSSSPTSTIEASPSPAATVNVLDTTGWQSFSSTIHGYDARYPGDWKAVAATAPASLADLTNAVNAAYDHFTKADGTKPGIIGTSTALPAGMTEDQWIAAYRAPVVAQFGEACFPPRTAWESVTVDGHPGGLYTGCSYVESTTFVAGRAYVYTVDLGLGGQASDETRQLLRAFLSTVVIHVGAAVHLPSTAPRAS